MKSIIFHIMRNFYASVSRFVGNLHKFLSALCAHFLLFPAIYFLDAVCYDEEDIAAPALPFLCIRTARIQRGAARQEKEQ